MKISVERWKLPGVRPGAVWGDDHVGQAPQRGFRRAGVLVSNTSSAAPAIAALFAMRLDQRRFVDHLAARDVHENCIVLFMARNAACVDQAAGLIGQRCGASTR